MPNIVFIVLCQPLVRLRTPQDFTSIRAYDLSSLNLLTSNQSPTLQQACFSDVDDPHCAQVTNFARHSNRIASEALRKVFPTTRRFNKCLNVKRTVHLRIVSLWGCHMDLTVHDDNSSFLNWRTPKHAPSTCGYSKQIHAKYIVKYAHTSLGMGAVHKKYKRSTLKSHLVGVTDRK